MLEIQGSGELHLPAKRAVENVVAHFLLGGGLQRGVRHPKTDGAAPCVVSVNYHFLQSQNTVLLIFSYNSNIPLIPQAASAATQNLRKKA